MTMPRVWRLGLAAGLWVAGMVGGAGVMAAEPSAMVAPMRQPWRPPGAGASSSAGGGASLAIGDLTADGKLPIRLDSPSNQQANLPLAEVTLLGPGGKIMASQSTPRGTTCTFNVAPLADGPYEVRCLSANSLGETFVGHGAWYKGDILAAAKGLMVAAGNAKPEQRTLAMLGEMVRTRLGEKFSELTKLPDGAFGKIHAALMEAEELKLGEAAGVRPYGFVRLSYADPLDDSVQFGRVYFPAHYDPAKSWPMVVVLHGYNPSNPPYVAGWGSDSRHNGIADKYDAIVVEPFGRGNSWYGTLGEADVVRCIEMAESKFSVDRDRVLLMGYSMGGWGTWKIGTRRPDLFAAIAPVYGGDDYRASAKPEDLTQLTDLERFVRERGSTLVQAESLLTTPVFINHGDSDDMVSVDISRYSSRMLQRWGYDVRYWEHPGKGHGGLGCEDEVMRWFLPLRRVHPTHVRLRAAELKSARSHWVNVTQRESSMDFVLADATITAPNVISLSTQNVLEVELSPAGLVDEKMPLRVIWNDAPARTMNLDGGRVVLRAPGYDPKGMVKTPQCEGPLSDQMTMPFAVVQGTASADPVMQSVCAMQAKQIAGDWEGWQHVKPRFFLDSSITEEDIARYSLILVGSAEANLVTRKLSDRLPLKIQGSKVTIGGKTYDAPDAAVGMIYPNPLNPQRYVVIRAATSPTAQFHHYRTTDAVDFFITDGHLADPPAGVPAEKVMVASGYFDHTWQVDPTYVAEGDASLRAKTAVRKMPKYLTAPGGMDRLMLSDLLSANMRGSFVEMTRDLSAVYRPIKLDGKTYASGIGVAIWQDTPCACEFDISGGGFHRLKSTIGIEMTDESKLDANRQRQARQTRATFTVSGDGKQLYRSPTVTWDTKPMDIDVDVTGVKTLRIEIWGRNPGKGVDSLDWADLRVEK